MRRKRLGAGGLLVLLALAAACDRAERLDYLIADRGEPVGTMDIRFEPVADDSSLQVIRIRGSVMMTAMGRTFDSRRDDRLVIDPRTGQLLAAERRTRLGGDLDLRATLQADADSIRVLATNGGRLALGRAADLMLEDGIHYGWLLQRLDAAGDTVRYRTVDLDRALVPRVTATDHGVDTVLVDGGRVPARRVDLRYPATAAPHRLWVDPRDGIVLRSEGPDGGWVSRGRLASGQRLAPVELDSVILAPVDTFIADERRIRAMTVHAVIDAPGARLDPAELNVPGQQFAGTVAGNRIDGVFTIGHRTFDPALAPPFPGRPDAPPDSLARYLAPSSLIESDDPEIVSVATEITRGSRDRWDAVQRLTRWVSEEIRYDIPGGGTASGTLRVRRGECGSHSRLLAAFCRAVGIPARMVVGGIYFHDTGGAFGQHAWTEVHLGAGGWVPLDATLGEWTVLDSGHIRLGETAAFLPVTLQILSFELADQD
ncbi:MAG: transglutaminase domain-containing protein [Candidatus Krumholzibacteriia bacterium]